MFNKKISTRSIQTIRNSHLINFFFYPPLSTVVEIKTPHDKNNNQPLFFIIIRELLEQQSSFQLTPFSECIILKNRLRETVKSSIQAPHINIEDRINILNHS